MAYGVFVTEELVFCRRCGETKARDAFYDLPHSSQPRRPCKACISVEKRARYAATDGGRNSHAQVLREKHDLTVAEYERMLAARGRGGAPRRLAVDHDRISGAVRQLLCHRCHLVTAAVDENPALLDAVRAYFARHAS
jgi:Recombination endonuclease VII